jgi:hypothetical protein
MTVDKELFGDTLPTYLTRFVGRDREIATVLSLLLPGRLVAPSHLWVVAPRSVQIRFGAMRSHSSSIGRPQSPVPMQYQRRHAVDLGPARR